MNYKAFIEAESSLEDTSQLRFELPWSKSSVINSEIESILQNHTWKLVDLLGCKHLGSK